MESGFEKPLYFVAICLLLLPVGQNACHAELPEVPLAIATDLDFSVEYSTDRLLVGDILYVKTVISNESHAKLRIVNNELLTIYAKSQSATELVWGEYCMHCSVSGGGLVELAPGQSIVCHQVLDVFGDDGQEDGSFSPFDISLANQEFSLHVSRSTIPDYLWEKIGSPKYLMKHEHKMNFGPPLIEKEAFDRAVAAELARDDLQPLEIFPFGLRAINSQNSYLMRRGFGYRDYNNTELSISACLHVLSQSLPEHSTLRRAASLTLASERLALSSPDEEAKAISDIIALLAEASPIEREFLKQSILADFQSSRIGTYRVPNVPKEIFDRFAQRLKDAGI